jgi:DNA-binding PadR family transcriptional regulator
METPFRITSATLDVLEAFLTSNGELHGFAVSKAAGRPTGSVYPILARMEQAGWLESRWEDGHPDEGRPRRRFYSLTGEGATASREVVLDRRGELPTAPASSGFRPAFRLPLRWVGAR